MFYKMITVGKFPTIHEGVLSEAATLLKKDIVTDVFLRSFKKFLRHYPVDIFLFKMNNENTRKMREILTSLTSSF